MSTHYREIKEALKYSSLTTSKRDQLRGSMDEFCTFSWCGVDAWIFGAFIENSKDDLKFYNGPSFSNTYATPQYNTSALLEGVSFKTQQIKFKIFVYWISDEEYRDFINWLNPYTIGVLQFDFNKDWGYRVKLANREDSTRWVVGYEPDENGISQRRYCTEMNLTFEVQGEPCAVAMAQYEYNVMYNAPDTDDSEDENSPYYKIVFKENSKNSDLQAFFKLNILFNKTVLETGNQPLKLKMCYKDQYQQKHYFTIFTLVWSDEFKQFLTNANTPNYEFSIVYDSESGIIYQQYGNYTYKLLNLWSTVENGSKVLSNIDAKKASYPGRFNIRQIDINKVELRIFGLSTDTQETQTDISSNRIKLECRARTNVI